MAELGLARQAENGAISRDFATRQNACFLLLSFAPIPIKRPTRAKASKSLRITVCGGQSKTPSKCRSGNPKLLSGEFFKEIIERPVPVDMLALKLLKRSPMALDIYFWLTYRMSYLYKDTVIPWPLLQMQFGADYAAEGQGPRDFKKKFLARLKQVLTCLWR